MSDSETNADAETKTEVPPINPAEIEALKDSVAKLEAKNRELLEARAKAKAEAEQAALEAAKKSGDIEALEKSWSQKLDSVTEEQKSRIRELEMMMTRVTSGSEARKLAADLALPGHSDLLLPHIERRLTTEIKDGRPVVRVLDADGRPSAMSVDDLRREIAGTSLFAPILAGSRANGAGGAAHSGGVGERKFSEYTSAELVALHRSDPQAYDRVLRTKSG
jgi:hypothetical protein